MGRESVSLNSTIALLQERFKKLERVREMREERELHRSATKRGAQVGLQSSEQPKWLFPGASAPSSGQLLSSSSNHVVDTSLTIGSWHHSDETDVDTSLHL